MQLHRPLAAVSSIGPATRSLFDEHRTLRAVIDAALEGRLGRVSVDDSADPTLGLLELGCYAVVGGNADATNAPAMLRAIEPPREIVLPDRQEWRDLACEALGGSSVDQPMRTFSSHWLDPEALRSMTAGLDGECELKRMGRREAEALGEDLRPHALQVYESVERFLDAGFGFCAVSGDTVACAGTSYAMSTTSVEIAISTRPNYRGQGLAQAVSAQMLIHCLEHGLRPEWSASNPVSKRLAVRLGYRPGPLADVLYYGSHAHG